jgi:hypothetical protein
MPNPKDVTVALTNLTPNEKYNYAFKSISSNWPITITPISGILSSTSTSGTISASAYFCPTKNSCDENYEGYLPCTEHFCTVGDDYFSNIVIEFNLQRDPTKVYQSSAFKLNANHSLPTAQITPSKTLLDTNEETNLSIRFINLTPQKTYQYSVYSLDANWPFVVSSPTGYFHSGSGGIPTSPVVLNIDAGFCQSTGICYNGRYGVLNYTSNNHPKLPWYNPEATIRLSYFDTEYSDIVHDSNIAKFYCSGCIASQASQATKSVNISLSTPSNCT